MYAYRNMVLADNGQPVGFFSDHAAALVAIFHYQNPDYDTMNDVMPKCDIVEEEKMKERIRFSTTTKKV